MGATIINESGLYNVILRSDKPEAKAFRKWITSKVLPSIRKHGVYATPETIDKIIADPDFGIRLLSTLKEERSARIAAQAELAVAAPKIESFEALMRSDQTMSITDAAKHFGLHPKTEVFPYLRELDYLTRKDLPTQAAIDAEYLALKETKCPDGTVRKQAVVLASQLETWRTRVVPQIREWIKKAA
jgi:phage antirepressor YoqD-like protein